MVLAPLTASLEMEDLLHYGIHVKDAFQYELKLTILLQRQNKIILGDPKMMIGYHIEWVNTYELLYVDKKDG